MYNHVVTRRKRLGARIGWFNPTYGEEREDQEQVYSDSKVVSAKQRKREKYKYGLVYNSHFVSRDRTHFISPPRVKWFRTEKARAEGRKALERPGSRFTVCKEVNR